MRSTHICPSFESIKRLLLLVRHIPLRNPAEHRGDDGRDTSPAREGEWISHKDVAISSLPIPVPTEALDGIMLILHGKIRSRSGEGSMVQNLQPTNRQRLLEFETLRRIETIMVSGTRPCSDHPRLIRPRPRQITIHGRIRITDVRSL